MQNISEYILYGLYKRARNIADNSPDFYLSPREVMDCRKAVPSLLLHGAFYRQWFSYLREGLPPGTPEIVARHLTTLPARRYLRRWLSLTDKFEIVRHHYHVFDRRLDIDARRALRTGDGIPLATLTGRSGRLYRLTVLGLPRKEGEITLQFIDPEEPSPLAVLRGSFAADGTVSTCFWVGALQGPKPPVGRNAIAQATRDLYGLRPKQAVLHATAALCAWAGVSRLYAPSLRTHILHRPFWRPQKVQADLDGFWREITDTRTAAGDYRVDLPLPRREPEEVKAKKRKEWTARYASLDAMTAEIRGSLEGLSAGTVPGVYDGWLPDPVASPPARTSGLISTPGLRHPFPGA